MSKWTIDPDHSVAAFAINHMMVADVHGQFNKITGKIQFDPDDVLHTSVELEIEVRSIITGIQKRDEHLKSQDFFDSEKYPKITFKSTKAEISGFNSLKITGNLNIRGNTHSITLDVSFFGPVKSPFGETSMGFTGSIRLNREDFGIKWNEPLESGGFMVGKDVDLSIDLEADLSSD